MSQGLFSKVYKKCSGDHCNGACNHIATTVNEKYVGMNGTKPQCFKQFCSCRDGFNEKSPFFTKEEKT